MNFSEAVKTCMSKFASFEGRAGRGEYWFFTLFIIVTLIASLLIGSLISEAAGAIISVVLMLVVFIPSLAVAIRRLHDTDRSGWWYLIVLVPYIGGLVLLVFMALPGTEGANDYGELNRPEI